MNHFQAELAAKHQLYVRQRLGGGLSQARVWLLAQGAVGRRAAALLASLPLGGLTIQGLLPGDVAAIQQAAFAAAPGRRVVGQPWQAKHMGLQAARTDLLVLATERPFPQVLERINQDCQRLDLPWTQVQLWGVEIVLGPSVVPGLTACHECYTRRRRANEARLDVWDARERYFRAEPSHGLAGQISPLLNQAAAYLSIEVGRLLGAGPTPASLGCELLWNAFTSAHSASPVVPVEHCTVCGGRQSRGPDHADSLDAVVARLLERQQEASYVER